jgi:hypothetical protein
MSLHQTNNVKEHTDTKTQATIKPDRNREMLPAMSATTQSYQVNPAAPLR